MKTLKYKVIASRRQYNEYCEILYSLLKSRNASKEDEIELVTVLIEKWDNEHTTFNTDIDPIRLLKSLMEENKIDPNGLAKILGVTKGMVSEILNYHKGLSKNNIRTLAERFKMRQEAFNQPYSLRPRKLTQTPETHINLPKHRHPVTKSVKRNPKRLVHV
jgi:HTH-type transcriptional regulator/antitoxin HigA